MSLFNNKVIGNFHWHMSAPKLFEIEQGLTKMPQKWKWYRIYCLTV